MTTEKKIPPALVDNEEPFVNIDARETFFGAYRQIQKELPVIGKNKQGHNSKYADLDKIWGEVKDIIDANGFIISNEINEAGVKTTATHKTGQSLESFVPFSKDELKPQEKGSEITYYRRYNLTAIFNIIIADEDDDARKATPKKGDYAKPEIDILGATKKLRSASNLDELKIFWGALTPAQRGDSEILAVKEEMKIRFTA